MAKARRKRSAKVYTLPGIERRDLVGVHIPSAEILQAAIGKGIDAVVIVGRARDGKLYVAAAHPDVDKNCGALMRAVAMLSNGDFS